MSDIMNDIEILRQLTDDYKQTAAVLCDMLDDYLDDTKQDIKKDQVDN